MATYREEHLENAPAWLQVPRAATFLRAQGDAKDAQSQRLRYGVRARFIAQAPPDALPLISQERRLARSAADTDALFAARLLAAWELWPWAGTPTGVLEALRILGYSGVYLVTATGRAHVMDAAGVLTTTQNASGLVDFGTPGWNRFVVLFPALPAAWAGVVPASNSAQAAAIREAIRLWKPAHMALESILIIQSGTLWGWPLTQAWGGFNWGGTGTTWTP